MAIHNELGKWGEDIACEKLIAEGYAICERNWRMGHYEIDIIASNGREIIFAEVKTRSDRATDPLEAVDSRKIRHMAASANVYLEANGLPQQARFDLFGISGTPDDYELEHVPDAFDVPMSNP